MKKLLAALIAAGMIYNCVGIGTAQAEVLNTPSITTPPSSSPPTAVFAWDGVRDSDVGILSAHNIKAVFLDINHTDCMPRLHDFHIYLLAGDTNWGVEEMKKAVDKAVEVGAKGLVFDIEGDYLSLADNLEKLRKRLDSRGMAVYVCIPYWLDDVNPGVLERIVRAVDCCVVMDYDRRNERQQMDEEIKLAKRYGRVLYHAIELQEPGRYGLGPINTYFGAGGVRAAEEKWRTEFKGSGVGFAIHNLEMLRREEASR